MTSPRILYVGNFLSAVANRSYCEDLADRLEHGGASVIRTSTRASKALRFADMLGTVVRRRSDYDVAIVDVYSGSAFVWAEASTELLRRLGKPVVLVLHGGLLPEFATKWPRRVQRLLRRASLVTAPSTFMQTRMTRYRDDIVVVRNAVDLDTNPYRPRSNISPDLIWVRAFHAIYNPMLAIDVVARLRNEMPEVRLRMLGPDKGDGTLEETRAAISERGLERHVEIFGRVSHAEVAKHLSSASILINTTNVDNTPLSILEAMASGVLVVTTAVGGIPHLLKDREDALLVPPRDATAMANAVSSLVRDPALAARQGEQARATAVVHGWDRVLSSWQHHLAQVAHG